MSEVPLEHWLARSKGAVALVFTDVIGSTLLLHTQKTVNYSSILRSHRARARGLIRKFEGRLIDQAGDGLLVAFPAATRAYAFASELFRDPGPPNLRIRAGMHFGTVTVEGNALVGRTVHLGARVMQHAEDPELWVSDAAKAALEAEALEDVPAIAWLASEECELRGIPDRQKLWRAA